jgi:hypothetical protein
MACMHISNLQPFTKVIIHFVSTAISYKTNAINTKHNMHKHLYHTLNLHKLCTKILLPDEEFHNHPTIKLLGQNHPPCFLIVDSCFISRRILIFPTVSSKSSPSGLLNIYFDREDTY